MSFVKVVIDCETGEQEYVNLTAEEILEIEKAAEKQAAEALEYEAARAAAESVRESGRAKLAALGLTEAEIAALVK
jgi:hypothetical protein